MRVIVDQDKCCGGGQCVLSAPDIFDQDDMGLVVVLEPRPAPERKADAERAAMVCPSACITIAAD